MRQVIDSVPLTEVAEIGTCTQCGALVLTGHAEGLLVRVDLVPIDSVGELAVQLLGRRTYEVFRRGIGRGAMLVYRDADRIKQPPERLVAAEHRCPPGWERTHRRQPAAGAGALLLGELARDDPHAPPPF